MEPGGWNTPKRISALQKGGFKSAWAKTGFMTRVHNCVWNEMVFLSMERFTMGVLHPSSRTLWGRSFPSDYLWTQCAWREPQHGSLMLSIATIPLAGGSFTGCICAVLYHGREYRLATYRGVRIKYWSNSGAMICQGKYRLAVDVLEEQGRPLRAPVEGAMGRMIHESLCAKLRYRFWIGENLLFEHIDHRASFEYADKRQTVSGQPHNH